jgi:uncharacterized protein (DUF1810 family)
LQHAIAQHFGIASKDEAKAYWHHPVLGPRLKKCVERVLAIEGRTALQIFGSLDDLKLLSSLTLFAQVASNELVFQQALARYFHGELDARTLELL